MPGTTDPSAAGGAAAGAAWELAQHGFTCLAVEYRLLSGTSTRRGWCCRATAGEVGVRPAAPGETLPGWLLFDRAAIAADVAANSIFAARR
jgi:hypothetical protein